MSIFRSDQNIPLSGQQHLSQRRLVWISLALTIVIDTIQQMTWKAATFHVAWDANIWQALITTFRQPLFHVTMLLYILQFFNWMKVLSNADLSYAQPITSLSYILVSVTAAVLFHEVIPLRHMTGIAMILLGVWFISSTSHRTTPRASALHTAMTDVKGMP
jgi:drug/metabolite transporter (DMT)-like permease